MYEIVKGLLMGPVDFRSHIENRRERDGVVKIKAKYAEQNLIVTSKLMFS